MTKTRTALAVFMAFSSRPAETLGTFLAATSDKLPITGKSAGLPEPSPGIQSCFTHLVSGKSPGSALGQSSEKNVDDCMSRCQALPPCLAMTFRVEDGLCNYLDRTYNEKYEPSDDRVVANKLDSCQPAPTTSAELDDKIEEGEKAGQVLPKISLDIQSCFTKVVFGRSPGSTLGETWEKSADDCMERCRILDPCLAMTFRLEDGLCHALGRTYDEKYEASDDRVVANKLDSCRTEPPESLDTAEAEEKPVEDTQPIAQELPKTSSDLQICFTNLVFGKSPGSSLGESWEKSVDDCLARCKVLDACLAITFRLEDGLCHALNRTYDAKYEASDERVLANKLDSCQRSQKLERTPEVEEKTVQVLPKTSANTQACFTDLVFGRSPGSTLGESWEKSVDDCMSRCEELEECLAMTFRPDDGLCHALNRTYDEKYEASDERVVANKLDSCQTVPPKTSDTPQVEKKPKNVSIKHHDTPVVEKKLKKERVNNHDKPEVGKKPTKVSVKNHDKPKAEKKSKKERTSASDVNSTHTSKRTLQKISDFIVNAWLLPFKLLWKVISNFAGLFR